LLSSFGFSVSTLRKNRSGLGLASGDLLSPENRKSDISIGCISIIQYDKKKIPKYKRKNYSVSSSAPFFLFQYINVCLPSLSVSHRMIDTRSNFAKVFRPIFFGLLLNIL
tara:strand:+ start:795 stop:1124 length:330 start_codon:yes stop_codon:yes gene_type:complete